MPPLVTVTDVEIFTFVVGSKDYSEIFDLWEIDTTLTCDWQVNWYQTTLSSPSTPVAPVDTTLFTNDPATYFLDYSPTLASQVDTYTLSYDV